VETAQTPTRLPKIVGPPSTDLRPRFANCPRKATIRSDTPQPMPDPDSLPYQGDNLMVIGSDMGPPATLLARQWWADAPMNDGLFVRWGAHGETLTGFVARRAGRAIRDARVSHFPTQCADQYGRGGMPPGGRASCLSLDLNREAGARLGGFPLL
jgi:hypothetical protein